MRAQECNFIFEEEELYARPNKPEEALGKRANNEKTTSHEDLKIKEWAGSVTRFKNGSTKALNLLRNSLSAPINTWIDFTFENEVETPNPENVKKILQAVER